MIWLIIIGTITILCIFLIYPTHIRYVNPQGVNSEKATKISIINSAIGIILCFLIAIKSITYETALFYIILGIIFYFINKYTIIKGNPRRLKILEKKKNNQIKKQNTSHQRFCKLCGEKMINTTICNKCGKHYFNFKKTLKFFLVIVNFLIILGMAYYIRYTHFYTIENLNSEIKDLKQENTTLFFEYIDDVSKAKFLDENIVFVIKGENNYYYTYNCFKKITSNGNYKYWAYNIEAAESLGYKYGGIGTTSICIWDN